MSQLRATLVLGKYRVIARRPDGFRVNLGGTTEMDIRFADTGIDYDLREGDILTFYTEVFVNPPKG